MKKCLRILAMSLAVVMLMSMTVLAANTETENNMATITGIATDATVKFATLNDGEEKINVTYTSSSLTEGSYYLILMVKGSGSGYTIDENSILYIDQTAAVADEGGGNPSVKFSVYPSSIQDSVILIAGVGVNGEAGPLVAAIVDAKYILGDVNKDGVVNSKDAVLFNQYLAKIANMDSTALAAADINKDGVVNSKDIVIMNQFLAKIIDVLG